MFHSTLSPTRSRHALCRESHGLRGSSGGGTPPPVFGDLRASRPSPRAGGGCPRPPALDQLSLVGCGHLRRPQASGPGGRARVDPSHRASGTFVPYVVALAGFSSAKPASAFVGVRSVGAAVVSRSGVLVGRSCGSLCCGGSPRFNGARCTGSRSRKRAPVAVRARVWSPRSSRSATAASAGISLRLRTRCAGRCQRASLGGPRLCGNGGLPSQSVACWSPSVFWPGSGILTASRPFCAAFSKARQRSR